jgi:hypothetical protein
MSYAYKSKIHWLITDTSHGHDRRTAFPTHKVCVRNRGARNELCFVATAVYGSPLEPEVVLLREFRDDVLLTSKIGELFVRLYYFISPPIAAVLAKSRFLKLVVRQGFLNPIVRRLKHSKDWQADC